MDESSQDNHVQSQFTIKQLVVYFSCSLISVHFERHCQLDEHPEGDVALLQARVFNKSTKKSISRIYLKIFYAWMIHHKMMFYNYHWKLAKVTGCPTLQHEGCTHLNWTHQNCTLSRLFRRISPIASRSIIVIPWSHRLKYQNWLCFERNAAMKKCCKS